MGNGRYAKRGALANPEDWASPAPVSNPSRPAWKLPVRLPGPKSPDAPFRVPGRSPRDVFPGRKPIPFGTKPFGIPSRLPSVPWTPRLPYIPGLPPWVVPLLDPWWADPSIYGPDNWSPAVPRLPFKPGYPWAPYMQFKCVAVPHVSPPNYPAVSHHNIRGGLVNAGDCGLALQAWDNSPGINGLYTGTATSNFTAIPLECNVTLVGGAGCTVPSNAQARFRYHSVWWYIHPGGTIAFNAKPLFVPTPFEYVPTPWDMPNPNDLRGTPTSPLGDPHEAFRITPSQPINFLPSPEFIGGRNPWEDWMEEVVDEVVKLPDDPTDGGEPPDDDEDKKPWGNVGYPPNMTNPHTRIVTRIYPDGAMRTDYRIPQNMRPPPKTKERKRRVRFFNWLDWISEAGEVVDALYEGLPKKVQHKWEKEHQGGHWVYDKREKRWEWYLDRNRHPAIDQAGQYGISGADWKARALWHNFHQVDLDAALRNVIKNVFEDRFLGEIHKRLPRNTGAALDPAFLELWKSFDTGMDKLLDWIMFDETAGSILAELQP